MSSRYRRYDHRIKNMIAETGDPNLFPDLAIPLSTAREWIKKGPQKVVSISSFDSSKEFYPPGSHLRKRKYPVLYIITFADPA